MGTVTALRLIGNLRRGLPITSVLAAFATLPASVATAAVVLDDLDFKHGIAFFHDLKYPPDYTHLDYLNPDAPKGGELVLPTQSAFNTLAPMATRGVGAPQGFWFTADTLVIRAGDEVSAFYGRLAEGIAVTPKTPKRWHSESTPMPAGATAFPSRRRTWRTPSTCAATSPKAACISASSSKSKCWTSGTSSST